MRTRLSAQSAILPTCTCPPGVPMPGAWSQREGSERFLLQKSIQWLISTQMFELNIPPSTLSFPCPYVWPFQLLHLLLTADPRGLLTADVAFVTAGEQVAALVTTVQQLGEQGINFPLHLIHVNVSFYYYE